jgi:hypothetical protein
VRPPGGSVDKNAIDRDGRSDVLDMLSAHRLEAESERLLDLPCHLCRHADAARLGKLLQAGRNVDPFAVTIFPFDNYLAEVDADPNIDASVGFDRSIALRHIALERHRAFDGLDHAAELGQQAIAHQFENLAMMPGDLRLKQFLPVGSQALEGIRLILLHEAGVADDVGG